MAVYDEATELDHLEREQAELIAQANVGDAIRREVAESRVVRLIIRCAMQEKLEALGALSTNAVLPAKQLAELHQKIYRANAIGGWIKAAIEAGNVAAGALTSEEPDTE